jgi:hypothetical protein
MGYYDFNDHFWSPLEVCAQAPKKQSSEKKFNVTNLVQTIFSGMYRPSNRVLKDANRPIKQTP